MQHFRANGKLLLSGEYFILDGAKGLALPTKFGQTLKISPNPEKNILWTAFDPENKPWFHCLLSETIKIIDTSDEQQAETLIKLINEARSLSEGIYFKGISAETHLEFPINWGLGSSSTLVSLLAQYFQCDPYQLLEATFGGSGYDIACATSYQPITYKKLLTKREVQLVSFDPEFKDQLYFLHLGKKQDTREGIQHYRKLAVNKSDWIEQITDITEKLLIAADLDEFCYYLDLHEVLIAEALQLKKVKETHFPDFSGSVKSLGAWGGDFVCVASSEEENLIRRYFSDNGFSVLLKFSDIILL